MGNKTMTNKELTNKELIDKAIKIISNPRTRFSSSGRWIELKRKGLISRVLSLHSGRTLNLFSERNYNNLGEKTYYEIELSPDFAPNMDQFVFLLRCKFPKFYNNWVKIAKNSSTK
jgi:hypothetical protein